MKIEDWGIIDYEIGLQKQMELLEKVIKGSADDTIVFCSHYPVVTLGKNAEDQDVCGWNGKTIKVTRGGRATYHGPSQMVVYPIVNLNNYDKDIVGLLRRLERSLVDVLKGDYQVEGRENDSGDLSHTGVWVGDRKLASIGIAVKRWTTYHGMAINLDYDPQAFRGINPCGYESKVMISLEELLNRKIERSEFKDKMTISLLRYLLKGGQVSEH